MTPLITRAFDAVPCDAWGDGAGPLFNCATALRPGPWPKPPGGRRALDTNTARGAATQAREADILAMRADGMSLREIRDASGYSSVSVVGATLARARRRLEDAS